MATFSKSRIVGAVEIGTSKITVLVGEANGSQLKIIGFGEFPSRGVVKGVVTDSKAAGEATHRAIDAAEKSAGMRLDQVFLAQSGSHIEGFYHEAVVNVGGLEGRVSQVDIANVHKMAKQKALPPGRCIVHFLRRPYYLDGDLNPSPEDIRGDRLSVGVWYIHGDEHRIADGVHIIRNFSLPVSEVVLSSLAAGNILTTPEERQHGVLVIDLGGGTTDYAYYRNGCPYVAGVVPVGGSHLTNDLALGLRITEAQAETIKHLHARATVAAKDRTEAVWLNGDMGIGDRKFPRMTIEQISAARTRETLEIVRKRLGSAFSPGETLAGVILTGGVTALPGIEEAAARVFEVPARIGTPRLEVSEKLRHPAYSAALGLLHQGLTQQIDGTLAKRSGLSFFGRVKASLDRLASF
ncbi:MAG: cell division protein FtsA [Verrucomicrobia bacterium]|nr:MAG: cell division protein FtsA [Verrucomicrobiota bacterium]